MGRYAQYKQETQLQGRYQQTKPVEISPLVKQANQNRGTVGGSTFGASQALGTASLTNLALTSPKPKAPTFLDKQKENIQALRTGEVKPMDVVKELPSGAGRVATAIAKGTFGFGKQIVNTFTNVASKGGRILGEGVAYATNKDVREQYEKGRTDILPTITDTTVGDMAKYTVAAGIEASLYKYIPPIVKQALKTRVGLGALEGAGFAITDGLARDKSAEEIIKSMPTYGVAGATLSVVAPYILPILKAEVANVPKEIKLLFNEIDKVPKKSKVPVTGENPRHEDYLREQGYEPEVPKKGDIFTDEDVDSFIGVKSRLGKKPEEQKEIYNKYIKPKVDEITTIKDDEQIIFYQPVDGAEQFINTRLERSFWNNIDENFKVEVVKKSELQTTGIKQKDAVGERLLVREQTTPKTVEVPSEQLPVGTGETKVSRLEARAKGIKDDINKLTEAEAEELGLSTYQKSDQEKNIATGLKYFEGKEDEAIAILNGQKTMPKEVNIETNALLIGMIRKAEAEGNTALIQKLATSTRVRSLASTRAGQEISILQKLDPDGVISKIAEVENVRIKAFERKSGTTVSETKKNLSKKAREQVDLTKLKLKEVNSLLDSITC
jgi:hypothetical protein